MPLYRVPIVVLETTHVVVEADNARAARAAARDASQWKSEGEDSRFHISVRTKVRIVEVRDGSVVEP